MPLPERLRFRLYAITDRKGCAPRPLSEVVHELLDAGVRGFQIREKDLGQAALAHLAAPIVRLCREYRAQVLINTHLQVALDIGADGVHLPASAATIPDPQGLLVGRSSHILEEVQAGADFLVYSPIFPTDSKPGYGPAKGLEGLRQMAAAVPIPVFALGGITPGRVEECLRAGAFGVAVMSGLMGAAQPTSQAKALLAACARVQEQVR